jgi:hypothetical protein
VKLVDISGSIYVSFMGELGDVIMGYPCEALMELREQMSERGDLEKEMRDFLNEHVYNKYYQVLIKATPDNYSRGPDGEQRFKYYAVKVFPHSLPEEDSMLLKRLAAYKRKAEDGDVEME